MPKWISSFAGCWLIHPFHWKFEYFCSVGPESRISVIQYYFFLINPQSTLKHIHNRIRKINWQSKWWVISIIFPFSFTIYMCIMYYVLLPIRLLPAKKKNQIKEIKFKWGTKPKNSESHEKSKSKLHNKITSEMLCENYPFRIVYQFSQHYFSRISYLVSRTTSIDRRMMKHDT